MRTAVATLVVLTLFLCMACDERVEVQPLIGVDICAEGITIVELSVRGRSYHLERFHHRPLRLGSLDLRRPSDFQQASEALREVVAAHEVPPTRAAVAIRGTDVITFVETLPRWDLPGSEEALLKAVSARSELDGDQFNIDFSPIEYEGTNHHPDMPTLVVAVPKSTVGQYVSLPAMANLDVVVADTVGGSLSTLLEYAYPDPVADSVMAVHFGSLTTMQIFSRGHFAFSRDIPSGTTNGYLSNDEARLALKHAVDVWYSDGYGDPLTRIYLSGYVDDIDGLAKSIGTLHFCPVEVLDPLLGVKGTSDHADIEHIARSAVAVGLAMRVSD